MYYTIYKITNQIDGKFYIGSHKTKDLNDSYMGSGRYLKRAQEKYGIENFTKEILFVFDNADDMYKKEAEIVNEDFLVTENTYNLKIGGYGGWDYLNSISDNSTHDPEFCRSISPFGSDYHIETGKLNGWFSIGGKRSKELGVGVHDPKLRASFKGKKHSQETKQKLSDIAKENSKGDKNSQYGTMWITNGNESVKIKKNSPIPIGWRVGRVIKKVNQSGC
jgi:hypothetical protein